MYKKITIFFLLYIAGVVFNPVLATAETRLDKSFLMAFSEDNAEEGNNFDDLVQYLYELKKDWHFGLAYLPIKHQQHIQKNKGSKLFSIQQHRASQRPLYLLFHSFLFYDLI